MPKKIGVGGWWPRWVLVLLGGNALLKKHKSNTLSMRSIARYYTIPVLYLHGVYKISGKIDRIVIV